MEHQKYQTFRNRVYASIIDGLIFMPFQWFDEYLIKSQFAGLGFFLWSILCSVVFVVYDVSMHVYFGQTIGKMITKVKVVDISEERNISFYQACMRNIVPIILIPESIYFGYLIAFQYETYDSLLKHKWFILSSAVIFCWAFLEIVTMLFNKRRRAIHDLIARSVVIKLS